MYPINSWIPLLVEDLELSYLYECDFLILLLIEWWIMLAVEILYIYIRTILSDYIQYARIYCPIVSINDTLKLAFVPTGRSCFQFSTCRPSSCSFACRWAKQPRRSKRRGDYKSWQFEAIHKWPAWDWTQYRRGQGVLQVNTISERIFYSPFKVRTYLV